MEKQLNINVFTLNIWGLGFGLSADKAERVSAIAEFLSANKYDIVLLQEVWCMDDYHHICERVKDSNHYCHYFTAGFLGSGTCVLSRFPILDVVFHNFSVNGLPHMFHHGDWFAGKGVGVCQLQIEDLRVRVFVSHFHAEYCKVNDIYKGHRLVQGIEAGQIVKMMSRDCDFCIYAGDFNCAPTDKAFKIMRSLAGLNDAWLDVNSMGGETCSTPGNSYTPSECLQSHPQGERIDFILYKSGNRISAKTIDCILPLDKTIPTDTSKKVSYSDHEGVSATFQLDPNIEFSDDPITDSKPSLDLLADSKKILDDYFIMNKIRQKFYVILAVLGGLAAMIFQNIEFFSSLYLNLVMLIACSLTVCVVLPYCFFMAFIFCRMEKRALIEAKATLGFIEAAVKTPPTQNIEEGPKEAALSRPADSGPRQRHGVKN